MTGVDMRVNLCGVTFKNPVIAASGTFAFGEPFGDFYDISKLGGISLKALTKEPRIGNRPPRIAETASGIINSVGLQNPGMDAFLKDHIPRLEQLDTVTIANIAGSKIDDYVAVIEKLNDTAVDMFELNISCPNVKQGGQTFGTEPKNAYEITKKAKKAAEKPLVVKLTPNAADIAAVAKAAEDAGADAVSLINTITAMAVDVKTRRPVLGNVVGGLSGPAVKPVALRMVYEVYKAVDIPVIGMGGITRGTDAAEFMLAGAAAVMVGTYNLSEPMGSLMVLNELRAFAEREKIDKITALTGALKTGEETI